LGKLLILWGLQLKRKIKKTEISWIVKILRLLKGRANLLAQTVVNKALQVITSDITYLDYGGGRAYLCVHKDSFAQVVYGWSLGITMETCLVMASLKQATQTIKKLFNIKILPKDLIWHQDQGSQNTSYEYVGAIIAIGRISYSNPGTPTDNPGQESFFGRLKDEHKDEIWECKTFEELRMLIESLITNYNTDRIHTSIGYQRPMQFLNSLLKF
jgi:putative transposase